MTSQSASNTSRRTTGLVTAALLAFSATTAPTSVDAAARVSSNAHRAAARRLEHDVPQPADAMFVAGPQCVKCCKPPPPPTLGDEIRQDGTGTGGAPPPPKPAGGSGKGKGTSASGTGPAPGGRRMKKANRNRRLAARGKDSPKRAQEFRELVHKDNSNTIKCVECPVEGMKKCQFTEADFDALLSTEPFQGIPKVVSCNDKDGNPEEVNACPSSEVLQVKTEFVADPADLTVSAGYTPAREGEAGDDEEVDLADHGGCGTMTSGTTPTRITFFMKAEHLESMITEGAVAEHLQDNIGPRAFCESDDGAAAAATGTSTTATTTATATTTEEKTEDMPLTVSAAFAPPGGGRKLEGEDGSVVTGFVPCSDATPYMRTGSCDGSVEGAECNIYVGQVCVYCDHDASKPTCYAEGVKTLQANANRAETKAIPSVSVVGAQMDSEVTGGTTGGEMVIGGGGATTSAIIGAEVNSADGGGSSLGIALGVGLGVCALLVVLLAVRKNRKAYTRDISFLDEEDMYSVDGDNIHLKPGDSSFDGTEIMSDVGSPSPDTKWRKSRPGHVVGEDDSVLSGNKSRQMVPRNLSYSEGLEIASPNDLARSGSGVDVHQCNSAMCEICLARGANPRFIPSNLEDTYIEGENRLNSSDLSYASRTYPMEDTVDF